MLGAFPDEENVITIDVPVTLLRAGAPGVAGTVHLSPVRYDELPCLFTAEILT